MKWTKAVSEEKIRKDRHGHVGLSGLVFFIGNANRDLTVAAIS